MKKTLMVLSSLLVAVGAFAQGQVNFSNRALSATPPIDAPVFVGAGTTKADGTAYMAQLYAGATATSLTAIAGTAQPFRSGAGAGYWIPPTVAPTISTVDAQGNAFVQVRAWATSAGATYEAALASGSGFGVSSILTIKPTVAPNTPADLTGLASFSISAGAAVPEPSIMALGALGGLVLLLRRRK
jgi:hypothetical protein